MSFLEVVYHNQIWVTTESLIFFYFLLLLFPGPGSFRERKEEEGHRKLHGLLHASVGPLLCVRPNPHRVPENPDVLCQGDKEWGAPC